MEKSKILVVEDNMSDFDSLKTLLENNNYSVSHAKTGEEAFTCLKHDTPDLVILDILLPDTDGFEVCKKIRKDKRFLNLPVLFYSVIRTIDDKLLGLEMGAALEYNYRALSFKAGWDSYLLDRRETERNDSTFYFRLTRRF